MESDQPRPLVTPGPIGWLRARPRLVLAAAAALCFAIALFRPGIHRTVPTGTSVLIVDITQSMNVADMPGDGGPTTRLDYTRTLLAAMPELGPPRYRDAAEPQRAAG